MATYNTREQAEQMLKRFPPPAGRRVEIAQNQWGSFETYEVKTCQHCGKEVHSAAIGEDDYTLCAECDAQDKAERAGRSVRLSEIKAAQVRRSNAWDREME
jgi:hypothetical protein